MLIFEKSRPGRGCDLLPASDVEIYLPEEKDKREQPASPSGIVRR